MKGKTGKPAMRGGGLARKGMGAALKGGGIARKGTGSNATPGGKVKKMAIGGAALGPAVGPGTGVGSIAVKPIPGRMPAAPGRPGEMKGPGEMGRGGGFGGRGQNIGFGMQKDMKPIGPGFGGGVMEKMPGVSFDRPGGGPTATTMPVNPNPLGKARVINAVGDGTRLAPMPMNPPGGGKGTVTPVIDYAAPRTMGTVTPVIDYAAPRTMKTGGKVAKYAKGGAVKMTAGAGSGSGRLEKVEAHKKAPRVKAVGLKKGGKVKAMAGGGSPDGDFAQKLGLRRGINAAYRQGPASLSARSEAGVQPMLERMRAAQMQNKIASLMNPQDSAMAKGGKVKMSAEEKAEFKKGKYTGGPKEEAAEKKKKGKK